MKTIYTSMFDPEILDESRPLGKVLKLWSVKCLNTSPRRKVGRGLALSFEPGPRGLFHILAAVFKMSFCCQPQTSCLMSNYNYGAMLLTTLTQLRSPSAARAAIKLPKHTNPCCVLAVLAAPHPPFQGVLVLPSLSASKVKMQAKAWLLSWFSCPGSFDGKWNIFVV